MKNQTTTSTETTATRAKAPKAEKVKFSYPFETKAQILASQTDFDTCARHLLQVDDAQTADEKRQERTLVKNKVGFMSSHDKTGPRLAAKIRAGEELTDGEKEQVRLMAKRYGKQLARFSRQRAIAANPGLKTIAAVFSAD